MKVCVPNRVRPSTFIVLKPRQHTKSVWHVGCHGGTVRVRMVSWERLSYVCTINPQYKRNCCGSKIWRVTRILGHRFYFRFHVECGCFALCNLSISWPRKIMTRTMRTTRCKSRCSSLTWPLAHACQNFTGVLCNTYFHFNVIYIFHLSFFELTSHLWGAMLYSFELGRRVVFIYSKVVDATRQILLIEFIMQTWTCTCIFNDRFSMID